VVEDRTSGQLACSLSCKHTHTEADVDVYTHSSCLLNLGIWTSISSYGKLYIPP